MASFLPSAGGVPVAPDARPEPLIAPFRQGQPVATLKIKQGEQALTEVPLVALEAVEEAGFFGRAWDAVRLWVK